jgi:hypothetical protein
LELIATATNVLSLLITATMAVIFGARSLQIIHRRHTWKAYKAICVRVEPMETHRSEIHSRNFFGCYGPCEERLYSQWLVNKPIKSDNNIRKRLLVTDKRMWCAKESTKVGDFNTVYFDRDNNHIVEVEQSCVNELKWKLPVALVSLGMFLVLL